MNRQTWLSLAAFFLLFAAANVVVLIVTGAVVKYLVLIVPCAVMGTANLYKALTTPDLSTKRGGA